MKKSIDIIGLPSGTVLNVTDDQLDMLMIQRLVKFVAFPESIDEDEPIRPLYSYCFDDEDYVYLINVLMMD